MLNVKPSSLSFSTSPSVSLAGLSSLDFSVGIVQPKCLHTSRFNSLRSFNCSLIFIIEIFKHKNKNKLSIKKIFYIKKGAAIRKLPPLAKKQKRESLTFNYNFDQIQVLVESNYQLENQILKVLLVLMELANYLNQC